jgi:hypothetical protein
MKPTPINGKNGNRPKKPFLGDSGAPVGSGIRKGPPLLCRAKFPSIFSPKASSYYFCAHPKMVWLHQ